MRSLQVHISHTNVSRSQYLFRPNKNLTVPLSQFPTSTAICTSWYLLQHLSCTIKMSNKKVGETLWFFCSSHYFGSLRLVFPGWMYLGRIPKVSAMLRPLYGGHHFALQSLSFSQSFLSWTSILQMPWKWDSYCTSGSEAMNEEVVTVCNHLLLSSGIWTIPAACGLTPNNASEMCWLHLTEEKRVQGQQVQPFLRPQWSVCSSVSAVLPADLCLVPNSSQCFPPAVLMGFWAA